MGSPVRGPRTRPDPRLAKDKRWRSRIISSAGGWRRSRKGSSASACSAGIPMLGLDALGSAAYGPEAALTLLDPPGCRRRGLHRADQHADHRLAPDRLLLLPADDRGLSRTGGGSYTVAKENLGTTAGLLAAAALHARLRARRGRRHLGRGRGPGLGRARRSSPTRSALCLAILAHDHARQSAGRPRVGRRVHGADVPVHRHRCWRCWPSGWSRRCWPAASPTPVEPPPPQPPAAMAASLWIADAGVRQRLHGDDGRRGRQQRRRRLPGAGGPPRAEDAHGDHRDPGRHAGRDRLPVPGLRHRRDRARARPGYQSILSQLVAAVVGRGIVLLRHDRLGAQRPGPVGQHRLRRLPAALPGDRPGRLPAARLRPPRAGGWCTRTASSSWRRCRRGC